MAISKRKKMKSSLYASEGDTGSVRGSSCCPYLGNQPQQQTHQTTQKDRILTVD